MVPGGWFAVWSVAPNSVICLLSVAVTLKKDAILRVLKIQVL